jgi:hypothetical protein
VVKKGSKMETTDDLKHWLEAQIAVTNMSIEMEDEEPGYLEGLIDAYSVTLSKVREVLGA